MRFSQDFKMVSIPDNQMHFGCTSKIILVSGLWRFKLQTRQAQCGQSRFPAASQKFSTLHFYIPHSDYTSTDYSYPSRNTFFGEKSIAVDAQLNASTSRCEL